MRITKKKTIITMSFLTLVFIIALKLTNIPIYTQNFGASLNTSYEDVDKLIQDADIIVDVEIKKNEYFEYENVPFTLSNAIVAEVHKGNIENQETINILETGGVINNVEHTFENEKVMKKKENAVVFLRAYEGPIKPEEKKYVILGVYQGKFKIDSKTPEVLVTSPLNEGELAKVKTKKDLKIGEQ